MVALSEEAGGLADHLAPEHEPRGQFLLQEACLDHEAEVG